MGNPALVRVRGDCFDQLAGVCVALFCRDKSDCTLCQRINVDLEWMERALTGL